MPEIVLQGCTPEPLMNYLKALGVLRLVSEQVDATARGCWRNNAFVLDGEKISRDELANFFLSQYEPSPIIAPWGARSGFYAGSPEKAARQALDRLTSSPDPRFNKYRTSVKAVRQIFRRLGIREKAKDEGKLTLMMACRNDLPADAVPWLDACYVLTTAGRRFPPLLGTGGNEGSGSYVSGFAQQLVNCLVDRSHDDALTVSLFGVLAATTTSEQAPGHFAPGRTWGPNGGQGFAGSTAVNPWDYLLCLEGSCLWASGLARRCGAYGSNVAAFPFTVGVSGGGASGLSFRDSIKPDQAKRPVAEMWLPIWPRPAGLREVAQLLAEGRATVGRRPAENGLDIAQAACCLGVDRGLQEFRRTVFLMRSGQSFLGVSLGAFPVQSRPTAQLFSEVDGWLRAFRNACSIGEPSEAAPRFCDALRATESRIFSYCRHGGIRLFQDVLVALGRAEREIALQSGRVGERTVQPISPLSPEWLQAADDGSVEFELAWSLAAMYDPAVGPLRANLEPVDWHAGCRRWSDKDRSTVWGRRDLKGNLAAVLARRMLDGALAADDGRPLRFAASASLRSIAAFVAGEVDDARLEDLLWGLILVQQGSQPLSPRSSEGDIPLPRPYALLKLLFLASPLMVNGQRYLIHSEPSLVPLLLAGRLDEACTVAVRRLFASGLIALPHRRGDLREKDWGEAGMSDLDSRRVAAALLLPVDAEVTRRLTDLVLRKKTLED